MMDRTQHAAAVAFSKPLFQHRAVCVVGRDAAAAPQLVQRIKADGARSVLPVEAAALAGVGRESIDVFYCALGELDLADDQWASLLAARSGGAVVVVHTEGDAARWAQALSRRFSSVERAEIVRGTAAWVSPPGAVTATVAASGGACGSIFVCADRPQRLALGSVSLEAGEAAPAAVRATKIESLATDIAQSLDEDRLREVEARLQQTMDDLVQAQLVAAQALAERDSLKKKLEQQKGNSTAVASSEDASLMEALRQELVAIEALVKRLPRV